MVVLHKKEVQKSWKLVPVTLKGSTAFMMSTANLKYLQLYSSKYKDRKPTVKLICDVKKRRKDEAVFEILSEDDWVRAP